MAAAEPSRLEAHSAGYIYQAARDLHVHQRDGTHRSRRVEGESVVEECPYPGLSPFDQEAARWFHGRAQLVAQLVALLDDRLRTGVPLLVVGPSGAGKSSLLRAGLLPALTRGALPGSTDWPQLLCTPTTDPIGMLTARLGEIEESGRRLVIVVDQLEELFIQCRDPAVRNEFLDALAELAAAGALVVYGLRADFYPMCADHPRLRAAVEDGQLLVGPMSRTELRETILFPAQDVGLDVEPGLVDLLLADVADGADVYPAGRLPLLAHALRATWRERHGSWLTVDGYRTTGGIHNAVATTAEAVHDRLPASHQAVARTVFLRLVRIGEGTADVVRRLSRAELLDQHGDPDVVAEVLDVFTAGRLLVAEQDTVRITHEALLHAWPRLRRWIDTDKDVNLRRQQLTEDAATWARNGKDMANLYRGSRLQEVRAIPPADLSPTAAEFLTTSANTERAAIRVRRIILASLAALVFFSASGAFVAYNEYHAKITDDQNHTYDQLTSALNLLDDTDATLAARLDVLAHGLRSNDQTIDADLINTENTALDAPLPASSDAGRPSFGPRGRLLAAGDADGTTTRLWDLSDPTSPRVVGVVPGGSGALDPATPLLATVGADGRSVHLWNVTDPARPVASAVFSGPSNARLNQIEFSGKGQRLAAYDTRHDMIDVWDVTAPQDPPWTVAVTGPEAFALSPDGNWLATPDTIWQLDTVTPNPVPLRLPFTNPDNITRINPIEFSPDGRYLATQLETDNAEGQTSYVVQLWDVSDPLTPTAVRAALQGATAAFSPNTTAIAVADTTGAIQLWNIAVDATQLVSRSLDPPTPLQHPAVGQIVFSPDGYTAVSSDGDGRLLVWHLPESTLLSNEEHNELAVSSNGQLLVTGGDYEFNTGLWNVTDPMRTTLVAGLPGTKDRTNSDLISPDNSLLFWSNANGDTEVSRLSRLSDPIRTSTTIQGIPIGLSANGHVLAVQSLGRPRDTFWNVTDPAEATPIWSDLRSGEVVFSAHSDQMAVTAPGATSTRLYDVSRREPRPEHLVPGTVLGLSADGRTLAVQSDNGITQQIQLWNTTNPLRPVRLQTIAAETVAFGPDNLLAVGSGNGDIQLWSTADPTDPTPTGEVLSGDSSAIDTLVFSGNGRLLISGSANGQIYIWDLRLNDAIQRICADTRPLTPTQSRTYAPGVPSDSGCP